MTKPKSDLRPLVLAVVCFWAALFCIYSSCSSAAMSVYGGIGIGVNDTRIQAICRGCDSYDVRKQTTQPSAYLGLRDGDFALEVGLGYARYYGHAVISSYRSANIEQQIDSRYHYAALVYFIPHSGMFVGAGPARVWARNHESGYNTPERAHVENLTYTSDLGAFVETGYEFYGDHWRARIAATLVSGVVRSVWTKHESIAGLQVSMGF